MKRVYRSRHNKVLGGVAAGLAQYFDIDVTVMRLLFALLLVTVPNVIIAYILAWIIIPEEPQGMTTVHSQTRPAGGETAGGGHAVSEGGMTADEIASRIEPSGAGAPEPEAVKSELEPVPTVNGSAGAPPSRTVPVRSSGDRSRQLFGFILIAVGAVVMLRRFVPTYIWRLPFNLIGQGWPVLIIIAGFAIIVSALRGR